MLRVLPLLLLLVAAVVLVVMLVGAGASAIESRRAERRALRRHRSAERDRLETLLVTARARRSLALDLLADPLVEQVRHAAVADLLVALDALPVLSAVELEGPEGAVRRLRLEAALAALDAATAVVARQLGHLRTFGDTGE